MLRECARVIKPGCKIGFLTIAPPPKQSAADRQYLVDEDIGPTFLDAGPGYRVLMSDAGFRDIRIVDCTPAYAETLSAWIDAREAEREALVNLIGEEPYLNRRSSNLKTLRALREGLICRVLVTAIR